MDKKKLLLFGGIAIAVIIVIIIVISLMGGGDSLPGDSSTGGASDGSSDGSTVVIEYWGLWEPKAVMDSIIEKFESENPGVKIQYTQKSFTQYEENSFTRVKEGSITGSPAPDVLRINNTWLSKFQSYLYPAPSNVITLPDLQKDYYPTVISDFVGTDSQIYALPIEIDGLAMFYNKELLKAAGYTKPPKTWDAVIEVAKELTKVNAGGDISQAGLALGTSNNIAHSADILSLLLLQNGVDVMDDTNKIINLSDPKAVSSLEFYTDFMLVHKTWDASLRSDFEMFTTGKLAMMIAPSWTAFDIINSGSAVEFDTVPTPIIGTSEIYYAHYWGEAVSRNSQHPADAWNFVKFLNEETQVKELYANSSQVRAFGEPYALKSLGSKLNGEPYVDAIMKMAPFFQAWKKGEEGYVNESLNTAINQVIERGVDVSTALSQAETRINEKLSTSIQ